MDRLKPRPADELSNNLPLVLFPHSHALLVVGECGRENKALLFVSDSRLYFYDGLDFISHENVCVWRESIAEVSLVEQLIVKVLVVVPDIRAIVLSKPLNRARFVFSAHFKVSIRRSRDKRPSSSLILNFVEVLDVRFRPCVRFRHESLQFGRRKKSGLLLHPLE